MNFLASALLGSSSGGEAIGWVAKLIMFIVFMCCLCCYCYSLLCLFYKYK